MMLYPTFKGLIADFVNMYGKDNDALLYYEVSDHIGVLAVADKEGWTYNSHLIYHGVENNNQWTLLLSKESFISAQNYLLFMDSVYEAIQVEFDNTETSNKTTNLGIDLDI